MGIPDNIKRLRATHGLTQSELGKIAGVSDKAIWTWENGTAEPRMGAIQKIADHFNIKKSDLIEEHTEQSLTTKPKAIKIPVLGMVHAGYPVDAIEDVLDWEEVTPEMSARGDLIAQ